MILSSQNTVQNPPLYVAYPCSDGGAVPPDRCKNSKSMTVNTALDFLNRELTGCSGRLTSILIKKSKQGQGRLVLNPELQFAMTDCPGPMNVQRKTLEEAMLAATATHFPFEAKVALAVNIAYNKFPEVSFEALSRETARTFIEKGLMTPADSVIEVGCGMGYFLLEATRLGIQMIGLEPALESEKSRRSYQADAKPLSEADQQILEKIKPLSIQAYSKQHPNQRASMVIVCNFSPFLPLESTSMETRELVPCLDTERGKNILQQKTRDFIAHAAALTHDTGKAIFGIASRDPHLVGQILQPWQVEGGYGDMRLEPILKCFFEEIEYIPADQFPGAKISHNVIGGQLGVYVCKHPMRGFNLVHGSNSVSSNLASVIDVATSRNIGLCLVFFMLALVRVMIEKSDLNE